MTEFVDGISSPIYRRLGGEEEKPWSELPIGALLALDNSGDYYQTGEDGLAIYCKLPDGVGWHIDSQASNCTWGPEKKHNCWKRVGTLGDRLTVEKGPPCCGDAGSIQTNRYHGFLRDGKLVPA